MTDPKARITSCAGCATACGVWLMQGAKVNGESMH